MVHKASSVFAEVELLEKVRMEEQRRHKSVSILGQVSKQPAQNYNLNWMILLNVFFSIQSCRFIKCRSLLVLFCSTCSKIWDWLDNFFLTDERKLDNSGLLWQSRVISPFFFSFLIDVYFIMAISLQALSLEQA